MKLFVSKLTKASNHRICPTDGHKSLYARACNGIYFDKHIF